MITIKEIIELANGELNEAISLLGESNKLFTVITGDSLNGEPSDEEPFATIEYDVVMEFGNIKRTHALAIGWNEDDGVGLEYGEDGEIEKITFRSLFSRLYFDLALEGLSDEYCI